MAEDRRPGCPAIMPRPGKPRWARARTVIAGAQSVASAPVPATAASAARAVRSASARSATLAGVPRAKTKAAAQATRISAARADSAESRHATRCARWAERSAAMLGGAVHNSESFTKAVEETSGKRTARAGGPGRRFWGAGAALRADEMVGHWWRGGQACVPQALLGRRGERGMGRRPPLRSFQDRV